jgi:hypothetical protein
MRKGVLSLVVLVLLTLLAAMFIVVAVTQNTVYLVPKNTSAEYCTTAAVEIWVDADNFQSGQINLAYDSNCANVTNWERNTTNFPLGGWDSSTSGNEWITFMALSPLIGQYHIGTLTIRCLCEDGCSFALNFTIPSALFDPNGTEISAKFDNKGFECLSDHTTVRPTQYPYSGHAQTPLSPPTPVPSNEGTIGSSTPTPLISYTSTPSKTPSQNSADPPLPSPVSPWPASPTPSKQEGSPGFDTFVVIATLLALAYLLRRK